MRLSESHWSRIAERGSIGAMRAGAFVHRRFGRGPIQIVLWLSAIYFFVASSAVRRGSRQYLEHLWASPEGRKALARKPGSLAVVRHIHSYAVSLYDRFVVWGGELDRYQVEHDGSERIFELASQRRGALLLGAHLGSYELLWFLSKQHDLAINVVVYYQNAERVNAFFEALNPGVKVRAIGLDPGSVNSAFQIKACIDRGEFVVILADRAPPGDRSREALVSFLGRRAGFPLSPFLLAGVLGCPVFLALCVRTGNTRYQTVLAPLREAEKIPRRERDKRARELVERYVGILESRCQQTPFEWFNFYRFWDEQRP